MKFKSDYKGTAYLKRGLTGFKLYHKGGNYGVSATEAIMKAVPRLAKQLTQSLDGFELWISDEELLGNPEMLISLDEAGINTSRPRSWLKQRGVEL